MSQSTPQRIRTAFTELMGVEHPVVLAPMALVSGGELAAAVSAAGGLGLVGGGYGDAAFLEQQFALAAGQRVGVGFITWSLARQPALLEQALAYKPAAVMLSFGDISPFVAKIRRADATLIVQVQTLAQAREAAALGADIVVAQGTEAGGHGAARATLPLVPAVVDALPDTPVLAAGGIADGRGLAAALMLGAGGALLGSRFYASAESLAPPEARAAAAAGRGDDTIRSGVFDALRGLDWPAPYNLRSLANRSTQQWHNNFEALARDIDAEQEYFDRAVAARDYDVAPVIVGEAVDLIDGSPAAAEIVRGCVEDAIAQLHAPAHFALH